MDPKVWWEQMPRVTRTLLAGFFVTTLAANFRVVHPYSLTLAWTPIWDQFQVCIFSLLCLFQHVR